MLSKNEIKNLRLLHQKKYRDIRKQFLVEGERIISDLVERHPDKIARIFVSRNFDLSRDLSAVQNLQEVDNLILSQLAVSKNPQGIVALVDYPEQKFNEADFILVLDNIQDPGNFGTIIRSAAWFGCNQIVCSLNTVDFCNPKVVQASMGTIFDVHIVYCDLPPFLEKQNRPIYGAMLNGVSLQSSRLEVPSVLIMGNEGSGISGEVHAYITKPLAIPKYGVGESLNVASATAIFLHTFASVR
jgi:TrmH family RNA methyltransferase